jgi:hypothetical protein
MGPLRDTYSVEPAIIPAVLEGERREIAKNSEIYKLRIGFYSGKRSIGDRSGRDRR